jgi:hypothetical protein
MNYDEFLARAKSAAPYPGFGRDLNQLYAEGGTLCVLVLMILQFRQDLTEALLGRQMMSDQDIRAAIGTQGQINGIDIVLHGIHEAIEKDRNDESADEVSAEQRRAAP